MPSATTPRRTERRGTLEPTPSPVHPARATPAGDRLLAEALHDPAVARALLAPSAGTGRRRQAAARLQQVAGNQATRWLVEAGLAMGEPGGAPEQAADRATRQPPGRPAPPAGERHPAAAALGSPGTPLDPSVRVRLEARLDHDFSAVRLHTDTRAAEAAEALGAEAFTVGDDVVFGRGRYAPRSPDGQGLLAHELAHVAQQAAEPAVLVQRQPAAVAEAAPTATGRVIEALNRPQEGGGFGDSPAAFAILAELPTPELVITLTELHAQGYLDLLLANARAAPRAARRVLDLAASIKAAGQETGQAAPEPPPATQAGVAPPAPGPVGAQPQPDRPAEAASEVAAGPAPGPAAVPRLRWENVGPHETVGPAVDVPGLGRLRLLSSGGPPPALPAWVPTDVVDAANSGRLAPGPHLLPYTWPTGYQSSLIVHVGEGGIQGRWNRYYRLYSEDPEFWLSYTRGDERTARVLREHQVQRNRDMWHFVKDLGYMPELAEAELDYIDREVFKALLEGFAKILGAGAGISQVGGQVARGSVPAAGQRLQPGEYLEELKPRYYTPVEQFGESLPLRALPARPGPATGGVSGGGGGWGMGTTLQAAPGGAVGTGRVPVPTPGASVPVPTLRERAGPWTTGSGWRTGYSPTPLPGVREGVQRLTPGGPVPGPGFAYFPPPLPVGTLYLPGAEPAPSGPIGDPEAPSGGVEAPAAERTTGPPFGDQPATGEVLWAAGPGRRRVVLDRLDRLEEDLDILGGDPDAPAMGQEVDRIRGLVEAGDLEQAIARLRGLRVVVDRRIGMVGEGAYERPFTGPEEGGLGTREETAPSGGGPEVQLDVNAPPAGDRVGERLLGHVRDAIARFEIEGFTPAQQEVLRDHPELYAAFRGARIDEFAKRSVSQDPALAHIISTGLYERGADFYDARTGRWYDITTARAWRAHVTSYGPWGSRLPYERR
jgi:hypothetical protein